MKTLHTAAFLAAAVIATTACAGDQPLAAPDDALLAANASCWGQATKVFAQMGEMGQHAAAQSNPRVGLRNLARALYEAGVIPDDSMAALGAFVASALGLSIDACL